MDTLTELVRLKDEVRSTYWMTPWQMSAVAALTLSLQAGADLGTSTELPSGVRVGEVSGTYAVARYGAVSPADLFRLVDAIYDHLLQNPAELDVEASQVLYSQLWDLYE